jgi:hypothetical protein
MVLGSISSTNKRFFSSPKYPDLLWGLSSLLPVPGVLFLGKIDLGVQLTTYVHSVLRFRWSGAVLLLPLYAFVVCTETTTFIFSPGHYSRPEGRNSIRTEDTYQFSNIFH